MSAVKPAASGGGSAYANAAGAGMAGSTIGGCEDAGTNKPIGTHHAALETFAFLKFTHPMMKPGRGERL